MSEFLPGEFANDDVLFFFLFEATWQILGS